MLKDAAMAWTEKKGWCCRLMVLIVMIAMVVLFGAAATAVTYVTDQVCPQGYYQYMVPACDDASMRAWLFQAPLGGLDSVQSSVNQTWVETRMAAVSSRLLQLEPVVPQQRSGWPYTRGDTATGGGELLGV